MPPKPRLLWTVAAPQSEVGSSVSLTGFGGSKPVVLKPAVLAPHTASFLSLSFFNFHSFFSLALSPSLCTFPLFLYLSPSPLSLLPCTDLEPETEQGAHTEGRAGGDLDAVFMAVLLSELGHGTFCYLCVCGSE